MNIDEPKAATRVGLGNYKAAITFSNEDTKNYLGTFSSSFSFIRRL